MDNNERDYLRRQIQELTWANRRWKALAIFVSMSFAVFLIVVVVGILGYGAFSLPLWRRAEMARLEAEVAREQAAEVLYAQRVALEERQRAVQSQPLAEPAGEAVELLGYPKPDSGEPLNEEAGN